MTIAPTKLSFIGAVAVVAAVGAVFTLVHQSAAKAAAYHADTSTSADITPTVGNQGSGTPLTQVTVNGVAVDKGTTTVPTPQGSATVTVSGSSATVDTSDSSVVSQTTSTPSGNLNVSIQSSSTGTTDASGGGSQQSSSHTTIRSSSSSDTSVSGSSSSHVDIETH